MAKSSRGPSVGIVTVAYRSNRVLAGFLDSVAGASAIRPALVIVDNAPGTDDASALSAAHGGDYIALPSNPGYGSAVNAGVRALPPSVEWVLISNPDVELGAGAIDALRMTAESDPTIGAVGPGVLNRPL